MARSAAAPERGAACRAARRCGSGLACGHGPGPPHGGQPVCSYEGAAIAPGPQVSSCKQILTPAARAGGSQARVVRGVAAARRRRAGSRPPAWAGGSVTSSARCAPASAPWPRSCPCLRSAPNSACPHCPLARLPLPGRAELSQQAVSQQASEQPTLPPLFYSHKHTFDLTWCACLLGPTG